MKKTILISMASLAIATTQSFAGGTILPPVIPVTTEQQNNPSPLYIGVGINRVFFDGWCQCGDVYEDYTYGALIRVGSDFNPYFGVELRMATTWIEEEGAKLKSHIGLYAKPQLHIGEDINVYGLIGYGKTEIGDTINYSESGLSWGVGLEFDLFEDEKDENIHYDREFDGMGEQEEGWGLFVDYQKLIEKDGAPDIHMISIGITYDF